MAEIKDVLKRSRGDYDAELTWHRFLVDAYKGAGGFRGKIGPPPSGFYGKLGQEGSAGSYLIQYPREKSKKFDRRVESAHYPNYVQPLTDLKVSYMLRKEFGVAHRPDQVTDWRKNVDGKGTTFDELRPVIVTRAATLGWCPVLVDADEAPKDEAGAVIEQTRAQADADGRRPRLIPLFPGNVLEYALAQDGSFLWLKVRIDYIEHVDPMEDPVEVSVYTFWYPDRFIKYKVSKGKDEPELLTSPTGDPHGFGVVPLTVLKHHADQEDPVKGEAMHGQVSLESSALYNRISELEEHLRAQVFAVLVMARKTKERPAGDKGETIGTDNALSIDPESKQAHYYLAPPASVAETYEKRIEVTIREIYRMARVEYTRSSAAPTSGESRKHEFAQTNRALSDFAKEVARWEEWVDDLVGRAYGVPDDTRDKEAISAPGDFDIEDLMSEMKTALDAERIKLGPTAMALLRKRIAREMLGTISEDDLAKIDAEIEKLSEEQSQESAMDAALRGAMLGGGPRVPSTVDEPSATLDGEPVEEEQDAAE